MYRITKSSRYGANILCIRVMKVAGALVSPKHNTINSKCPYLVLKAVLGSSPLAILA